MAIVVIIKRFLSWNELNDIQTIHLNSISVVTFVSISLLNNIDEVKQHHAINIFLSSTVSFTPYISFMPLI